MIYFVQGKIGTPIKIGYTQSEASLASRVRSLQTGYPWELRVLGRCDGSLQDEHRVHQLFADYRLMGEWFDPAPRMGEFIGLCEREGLEKAIEAHGAAVQADGSSRWDDLFIGETTADHLLCLRPGFMRLARLAGRAPEFRPVTFGSATQRFYRVGDLRRWLIGLGHQPRINIHCVPSCRSDPAVRRWREGSCFNIERGVNTYGDEPRLPRGDAGFVATE